MQGNQSNEPTGAASETKGLPAEASRNPSRQATATHASSNRDKQDNGSLAQEAAAANDGNQPSSERVISPKSTTAASPKKAPNNTATAQAANAAESYDLQMDQFQVIDNNKEKQSYLQSPNDTVQASNRAAAGPSLNQEAAPQADQADDNQASSPTFKNDSADKREDVGASEGAGDEGQFFLTGVNVQNQDIEPYAAIMEDQEREQQSQAPGEDHDPQSDLMAIEESNAEQVNGYKLIAVVDAARSFANNECVYVNTLKNEMCHLSVGSHTALQFDELISSYDQVFKIGKAMAHRFMTARNANKVVLNVADQFATNNNCGFNLANFKLKFLKNYFNEVVADYERSFIGSFASALFSQYMPAAENHYELYFTIAKFDANMGYSLTQNVDESHAQEVETRADGCAVGDLGTQEEQEMQLQGAGGGLGVGHEGIDGVMGQQRLEAKGLQQDDQDCGQANQSRQAAPYQGNSKVSRHVQERRAEIMKKGSIPEFVPVRDAAEFYRVYQEANYRNKLLVESQQAQQAEAMMRGEPIDPSKLPGQSNAESVDLRNIKDDVIIMQFKLVRKDTMKILNTHTFINVPTSKTSDINISTLMEIINKQNQARSAASSAPRKQNSTRREQFLPYNKSILTRILYPCLNKSNYMVINHFSKKTILRHLNQQVSGYQTGPAKGLFSSLFKLGFDSGDSATRGKRLIKKKLTQQEALKVLQRTFKGDLTGIFKEIDKFREGMRSFEVYTEQTANQLAKSGVGAGGAQGRRGNPLTMFHQIMYFLVLQEEMTQDAETFCGSISTTGNVSQTNQPLRSSNFFPSLLPESEIQKVIFDANYLDFIQKKNESSNPPGLTNESQQVASEAQQQYSQMAMNLQIGPYRDFSEAETVSEIVANTSVQQAAALAKESHMPHAHMQQAANEKEKKLQFVQYECIKSELKDEYDKKVGFLHKRFTKKAQVDPSFMLLSSMTTAGQPATTKNINARAGTVGAFGYSDTSLFQAHQPGCESRATALGQQIQLQRKILGGPGKARLAKSRTAAGGAASSSLNDRRRYGDFYTEHGSGDKKGGEDDRGRKPSKQQRQGEYYKFYLDNAQKAIDLMIEQHKSAGNLRPQNIMRGGVSSRGPQSASSNQDLIGQQDQADFTADTHADGKQLAQSAAGFRTNAYTSGGAEALSKKRIYGTYSSGGVNRSSSLHERRFNLAGDFFLRNQQRLEPLVARHQKINRITVRNGKASQYGTSSSFDKHGDFTKGQQDPSEGENGGASFYTSVGGGPSQNRANTTSGQISFNQRRSKPFSANQNTKMRVIQETHGVNQASSTQYGSSFNQKPNSLAANTYLVNKRSGAGVPPRREVARSGTAGHATVASSNEDYLTSAGAMTHLNGAMRGSDSVGIKGAHQEPKMTVDGQINNSQANLAGGLDCGSDHQRANERRPGTSGLPGASIGNRQLLSGQNPQRQVKNVDGALAPSLLDTATTGSGYALEPIRLDRESSGLGARRAQKGTLSHPHYAVSQTAEGPIAGRSFTQGKRQGNLLPPTGQRGTGIRNSQATQAAAAKRLLSNTGASRGASSGPGAASRKGLIRGELLTNGYKSLRAQGMLRAVKVNGQQQMSAAKKGADEERVNICIEANQDANSQAAPVAEAVAQDQAKAPDSSVPETSQKERTSSALLESAHVASAQKV